MSRGSTARQHEYPDSEANTKRTATTDAGSSGPNPTSGGIPPWPFGITAVERDDFCQSALASRPASPPIDDPLPQPLASSAAPAIEHTVPSSLIEIGEVRSVCRERSPGDSSGKKGAPL
jgi:hypothetical protein